MWNSGLNCTQNSTLELDQNLEKSNKSENWEGLKSLKIQQQPYPEMGDNTEALNSEGLFQKTNCNIDKTVPVFLLEILAEINRKLSYSWNNIIITEDVKQLSSFGIFKRCER